MYRLFTGTVLSLAFIQSAFALENFTLTSKDVSVYVQQCQPDINQSNIEREVKSLLALLASATTINNPKNLKISNLKLVVDKIKNGKMTEYIELDGLMFRGIPSSDFQVVDILTKHLDAQKSWYKDEYQIKKTVSGNTTYIQRSCQTITCKKRNLENPFSLASFRQSTPCSDALCAMKQIYGEEKGPLILYAYLKYGLNVSPKTHINADPEGFDVETLTAILSAAAAIPEHLHSKVFKERNFYRFARGQTLARYGDGDSVIANAAGAVFDSIDDYDYYEKIYIFVHEMAHRSVYREDKDNLDKSAEWLQVTNTGHTISEYSLENAVENFAETFTLYRLYPQKLQQASPQRFSFMKSFVFGGIDYRDNLCKGRSNLH